MKNQLLKSWPGPRACTGPGLTLLVARPAQPRGRVGKEIPQRLLVNRGHERHEALGTHEALHSGMRQCNAELFDGSGCTGRIKALLRLDLRQQSLDAAADHFFNISVIHVGEPPSCTQTIHAQKQYRHNLGKNQNAILKLIIKILSPVPRMRGTGIRR